MEQPIKQFYEAPLTTVLEVRQEGVICASGVNSTRPGYGTATDEEWD